MNQNTAPHSSPAMADDEISLAEIYDILRAGWRPVAALALLGAGFADSSHFSRAFRAHVGCSPSEYRQRIQ